MATFVLHHEQSVKYLIPFILPTIYTKSVKTECDRSLSRHRSPRAPEKFPSFSCLDSLVLTSFLLEAILIAFEATDNYMNRIIFIQDSGRVFHQIRMSVLNIKL